MFVQFSFIYLEIFEILFHVPTFYELKFITFNVKYFVYFS